MFEDFGFDWGAGGWQDMFGNTALNTGTVGGPEMLEPIVIEQTPPVVTQPNPVISQDLASNIVRIAERLKIDPIDLATVISYETAGTFDPDKKGPTTPQWGLHQGLIQWGERGAGKDYGYKPGMPVSEQMDLVERYLLDRGFKPGGSMLDLYSTINAGRPGLYNARDAASGGAPGTVADKVNNQMAGHRIKAALLLDGKWTPQSGFRPRPSIGDVAASGGLGQTAQADEQFYRRAGAPPPAPAPMPVEQQSAGIVNAGGAAAELQAMLDEESGALTPDFGGTAVPSVQMPDGTVRNVLAQNTEPTFLDKLDNAVRTLSKGGAKVLGDTGAGATRALGTAAGTAMSLPSRFGAGVSALSSILGGPGAETATNLMRLAEGTTDMYTEGLASRPDEGTAIEKVAPAVGRSAAMPGGVMGASYPLTVGAFTLADLAGQYGSKFFAPDANAGPPKKYSREELTTMGMSPTIGQNAQLPGPRPRVVTHNNATWAERMNAAMQPLPPQTIQTPAGPTVLPQSTLATMGIMTAASLGMMVAPWVVNKVTTKMSQLPAFDPTRPVPGAPGTFAISRVTDLARSYDDSVAPIINIARRAGMPTAELQAFKNGFRIQTGAGTQSLVQAAITDGKMQTPSMQFNVPVSIEKIGMAERNIPNLTQYLQNHALADAVIAQQQRMATATRPAPPIGGANFGPDVHARDVISAINVMNRQNPAFRQAFQHYSQNITAGRNFIGRGEWAIEPPGNISLLNRYYGSSPILTKGMASEVLKRVQQGESPVGILQEQFQKKFRARMENEIRAPFVVEMSKIDNGKFMTPRTAEWVKTHPGAVDSIVKIYQRGKPKYFTTDPLLASHLKKDLYYITSTGDGILYATKRMFESTTTGALLAPYFAMTNLARTQQLAWFGGIGDKKPMPWNIPGAVAQQWAPQMAKNVADSLHASSGGWLGTVLGPQNMQILGQRVAQPLQRYYDNSFMAQIKQAGGMYSPYVPHNWTDVHTAVRSQSAGIVQQMSDLLPKLPQGSWSRTFLEGWTKMVEAHHNAAAFSYMKKNRGKYSMNELVMKGRDLTGDPTNTGQFYVGPGKGQFKYVPQNRADLVASGLVRGYGLASEFGRVAVPWFNPIEQGMKKLGRAYIDNPVKFMSMVYATQVLPTAAMYMYTRSLNPHGDNRDPNGVKYIDYLMDGRSEYDRMMNLFIPIEGRPVAEGRRIPFFHEMAPVNLMTLHALDQAMGRSSYTPAEAFKSAAWAYAGLLDPPIPPLFNIGLASAGMGSSSAGIFGTTIGRPLGSATGTPFGGEAFKKRSEPYDQLGGMNGTVELMGRSLMPGLTDIFAATVVASMNADEATSKFEAARKAFTRRTVEKAPILRDILGYQPAISGNTVVAEEMFAKSKAINGLLRYYRTNIANEGAINIKPASIEGGTHIDKFTPKGLPPADDVPVEYYKRGDKRTGVKAGQQKAPEWANAPAGYQPEPTNPLFKEFAAAVMQRFEKDKPSEGGFGYKSLWRKYHQFNEAIKKMGTVNDGNLGTYLKDLPPEYKREMFAAKVNSKNPREVRNYFNHQRNEMAKVILNSVKAVEQEFSKDPRVQQLTGGKPFKIEMIDPYGGLTDEGAPQ